MAVCVDLKDNSHVIPLFKLSNSDSLIRYTLFIGFFFFFFSGAPVRFGQGLP